MVVVRYLEFQKQHNYDFRHQKQLFQIPNSKATDVSNALSTDVITNDPVLIENSTYDNALPTYYKIRGLYPPSGLYETFISVGIVTNINPTNNHVLTNTSVIATWISESISANVSSS